MRFLCALVCLLLPVMASAQVVVINPKDAAFTASPDHGVTIGTTAVVTKYELVIVRQSAPATPVVTSDLGKPVPVANVITVPVPGGLPNNTLLQAFVRTTGPGGATAGVLSDPFAAVGPPAAAGKPVLTP